jgi:hypothetical protein
MTTYAALTARVKAEATISANDTAFDATWNAMLLDAEIRIFRDLDPLVGRKFQMTTFPSVVAIRSRLLVPPGCIIMRSLVYFTPVGSTTKRNAIKRRDEDFCNDYWPDRSLTGPPKFFCELAHNQVLVVPTANDVFKVQMAFTHRPTSLSSETGGTYISQTYPDLLFFAAMVEVAGFKKNYGAMADDPKQALTWDERYKMALAAAVLEEARRKRGGYANESQSQPPERNAVQ